MLSVDYGQVHSPIPPKETAYCMSWITTTGLLAYPTLSFVTSLLGQYTATGDSRAGSAPPPLQTKRPAAHEPGFAPLSHMPSVLVSPCVVLPHTGSLG